MSLTKNITKLSKQVLTTSLFVPVISIPVIGAIATNPSLAQSITPEPAPNGTATTITTSANRYDISGGKLSQDGKNLFHSFSSFGLQQNEIANFLSQPTIQNILGRVSGGSASVINGIIQVTGGYSNLYLMNPAGIIFGRNASLNVPASFTATTANGIGFGADRWFSASGTNDYASLMGTPSGFAFTMLQPAAIINAANLALKQRGDYSIPISTLTLLGGTVASTGQLSAPGGNIIIAAVPGTSLVRLSPPGSPLGIEIQPIASGSSQPTPWTLPVLSLAQLVTGGGGSNATGLTVNPNGTVQITGSGISVENGDIVTGEINTSSVSIPSGGIVLSAQRDINTTGGTLNSYATDVNASAYGGGIITLTATDGNITTGLLDSHASATYGSANSGAIVLNAHKDITTGNLDSQATSGNTSNAGAITLTTQKGNITTGSLDSHAEGQGATGGAIAITAQKGSIATATINSHAAASFAAEGGAIAITAQKGNITTATIDSSASAQGGSGTGGEIALTTQNGDISTETITSGAFAYASASGGAVTLTTQKGNIFTGTIDARGGGQSIEGGAITLATSNGNITTGALYSGGGSRFGNGGAITLNTHRGNIATSDINSASTGFYGGNGGTVSIKASNSITSGNINSSSSAKQDSSPPSGNGGAVTLNAHQDITVSSINAQGGSNGTGGNVNIRTAGVLKVSGFFLAADGVTTASISTQGGTGGGQIKIVNSGGLANLFKVGDATTNGTAKDITSGNYQISSTPIFTVPSPIYTQGNIQIITLP